MGGETQLPDPPDLEQRSTGAVKKGSNERMVIEGERTSKQDSGKKDKPVFNYTVTDSGPYRVYFEPRSEAAEKFPQINKFALGSALRKMAGYKNFISDMKYVSRQKIIVFLSSYNKANKLVEEINASSGEYKAYIPKHLICITGIVNGIPINLDMGEIQEDTEIVCHKCLRFGHNTTNCKGAKRCDKCAERHENDEDFENCLNPIKCANCRSREHSSTDIDCPEKKRQQTIKMLMSKRNWTYAEAREQVTINQNVYAPLQNITDFPTPAESYASMTQGNFRWKDPLREQWTKTNQDRKSIQAAVKLHKDQPNTTTNGQKAILSSLDQYNKVIIGGDFNAHHNEWGDDVCDLKGRKFLDAINNSRLLLLNDGSKTFIPTQLNKRSSAIDITLCSVSIKNLVNWKVLDYGIASHHMCLEILWVTKVPVQKQFYYNKTKIANQLSKLDASQINCVNDLTNNVKKLFKENRMNCRRTPKFWWSDSVDEAWKQKTEARRKYNRHSTLENLIDFKRKAANFQRKKREETRKKFEEFPNEIGPFISSKLLWLKVGRLTGKRFFKKENNILHDDETLAEQFLDMHFGPNDPQSIETPFSINSDSLLNKENWYRILGRKKKSSAPGEDNLSYELLSNLKTELTEKLISLLNEMWRRSTIDKSLKIIKVIAIPKPGRDQNTIAGKRPISLVPAITKLANSAVLERLQKFLDEKRILPDNSFGFRKNLSTNTCVNYVLNWVKQSRRLNFLTALICIDLSNAFNAVRLDKLEEIMLRIGVPQDVLLWTISFLNNRQIVFHTSSKTITRTINNGLPQGDVLSPTLFNIYTIDLHRNANTEVELVQFADDFGILLRAKNIDGLNELGQEYLINFTTIAESLNFSINPEKTKALLFQNGTKKLNISINGIGLETVKCHKYLGVTFDRSLSFGIHIKDLKAKIQDRLNMVKVLNGVKHGAHPQTMLKIHTALFRATMEQNCSVYNNSSCTNRNILTVINNQCLRRVTGLTRSTPRNVIVALSGQEPVGLRQEFVTCKELCRHFSRNNVIAQQLRNVVLPEDKNSWKKFSYQEQIYWVHKEIFDNIQPILRSEFFQPVEIFPELEGLTTTKQNTNPMRSKQLALFVMNGRNKGRGRVFTDASKDGSKCSIGVFFEMTNLRLSMLLGKETSITSAELIAIREATRIIEERSLVRSVIYTDSKASCLMLQAAQESKQDERILIEILRVCSLHQVAIQWIPSHVSIQGNEIADSLAKHGLQSANVYENHFMVKDSMAFFKRYLGEKTESWYSSYSEEKGKIFHSIQPKFSKTPWFIGQDMDGRDIRLLNRLMTTHDYSKYWLARMKIVEDANCETCSVPETANHIIIECPRFTSLRLQYDFNGLYSNIQDIFKSKTIMHYKEIVEFVRKTKIEF
ncbi:uncharacterized protein LOC129760500 [Uranotaenia lowii]|uniref:uncharacterized protein LOC129760500 n=1 Tax=Uranotaenia lowii TaxID=190385 RepID=UPI002478DF0C|nr:uncharacterized protein LOC129760500 [Uranotaenia lowii]